MNLIALFFICLRMYSFMRAEELAYFLHTFSNILKARRENPKQKQIIYMDKTGMQFIIYLLMDISFLLYCLYLLADEATWKPGFFLLSLTSLEAYALHFRVYGTYVVSKGGYVVSNLYFRYVMTGLNLYILLKLFKG
jgi:hypothetical protein